MTGRIHSFETFGTVDGPGIRFVVFMQGCPMRCKYCHNPDTWEVNAGKEYEPEEVVKEVLKYKNYLKNGGVTVSGGEPLLQIDFLTEFFRLLKQNGIHTALDTSGVTFIKEQDGMHDVQDNSGSICTKRSNSYTKRICELLKNTDLVLLDIKHIDENAHKTLTGHTNKNTLDFARFLSDEGVAMWIRHVLVPDVTDDDESLKKLKVFIDGLKTVEKVEVLPYHTMGEVKYEKLGIRYPLKGTQPPTEERVLNARNILNAKANNK